MQSRLLATLAGLVSVSLMAAVGAEELAAAKAQTSNGLGIEVMAQPRQVDLPGAFKIAFRVQNKTGGKVVLKEFTLTSVEAMTPLEIGTSCASGGEQISIEADDIHTVTCEISSPGYSDSFPGFFLSLFSRWSMLTLSPGDYQFVAAAIARGSNANGETFTISASKAIPVRLSPTVWQAVIGAMLGSLLMVIFWLSSPRVREQVGAQYLVEDHGFLKWLKFFLRAVALWCGSTTAATIAIFLTFRMKDASLPFTLSVNDFYGGLVVGLLGVVITNWLGPKLFGEGESLAPKDPPRGP